MSNIAGAGREETTARKIDNTSKIQMKPLTLAGVCKKTTTAARPLASRGLHIARSSPQRASHTSNSQQQRCNHSNNGLTLVKRSRQQVMRASVERILKAPWRSVLGSKRGRAFYAHSFRVIVAKSIHFLCADTP